MFFERENPQKSKKTEFPSTDPPYETDLPASEQAMPFDFSVPPSMSQEIQLPLGFCASYLLMVLIPIESTNSAAQDHLQKLSL